ncbi:toll/interleukin-1 receptor domain-containing protein [Enorma sp.]|uniref:toll/interleukin-1 receptor domain-containing protein n=1 Tax=Enorma sp. TaxID=1920692 RepID=UPI0025C73F2C|nr:toll/interleukin-1 receptor domain-containing protein [Enorma sp.]
MFISYAWESEDHRAWVRKLADKLLSDGIEAIVDQYDLNLGDRLPQFMEQSVTAADYVLIVCAPTYKAKADARVGGVGYEGHIISEELYSKRNERKFIPVLKSGTFEESVPTYLAGKLGIDLSNGLDGENYENLVATLFHAKKKPPVRRSRYSAVTSDRAAVQDNDEPIRIVGIIVDEVTEPRNDGTPGSALYRVPFRLSRTPSSLWKQLFLQTWDSPPRWSTMHRPGIASVSGDKIILDGTTIEEVRDVHRETLLLCVDKANALETHYLELQRKEEERKRRQHEEHKSNVMRIADDITF